MQQPQTLAPAPHPSSLQSPTPQEVASSAEQSWYPMNTVASSFNSESSQDLSIIPYTMLSGDELLTYQSVAALRAHLLQNIHSPPPAPVQTHTIQVQGQGQVTTPPTETKPGSSSPHDMNIDPAISGVGVPSQQAPQQQQQTQQQQMMVQPQSPPLNNSAGMSPGGIGGMDQHSGAEETGAEGSGQKRGGKRELSTSKRAAQNRAAQRAFRQRKEGYIKKLEEQVRDFTAMQESYKQIQAENYQLRDYIINLQSRLIESQGEDAVPPPPLPLISSGPPPPMLSVDPHTGAVAAAPTANMMPVGVPDLNNVNGKRLHDEDSTNAFLQNVAAAGNGFLSQQQQQQAQQQQQQIQQQAQGQVVSPVPKRLKNGNGMEGEVSDVGKTTNGS